MKKVTVKQTRSAIGRNKEVERTLASLGLGRIGKERTLPLNSAVEGLIRRVRNLLEVRPAQ